MSRYAPFKAFNRHLEGFAQWTTEWTGSSTAFLLATSLTLLWIISGPLFHFSDTWQLVMNTISSIVTFLMVFLIQRSQNKDSIAVQIKLDELIAATKGASNRLIDVEELQEGELKNLHEHYRRLAQMVAKGQEMLQTLSIENEFEEESRHPERPAS